MINRLVRIDGKIIQTNVYKHTAEHYYCRIILIKKKLFLSCSLRNNSKVNILSNWRIVMRMMYMLWHSANYPAYRIFTLKYVVTSCQMWDVSLEPDICKIKILDSSSWKPRHYNYVSQISDPTQGGAHSDYITQIAQMFSR